MFKKTGKPNAPWVVIDGNERDVARKEVIRYVIDRLEYDKKGETGERLKFDKSIVSEIFDEDSLANCLSK